MWLRTLFNLVNRSPSRRPIHQAQHRGARRRPTARLCVEALEDRLALASLSVGDATLIEGNAGTQYAAVVVSLNAPSTRTVSVNFNTADGTAKAGSDYEAASGKLIFAPGETSKTVLVSVSGDRVGELDETFVVKIQGAKNATIANGRRTVTIVDDEPRLSITGAAATEGNSGTTLMTFTVTLSAAHDEAVTVDYATADGAATTADNDYLAAFGTLTFAPGETSKTITVEILGDTTPEPDETFYVILSGASVNASIADFYYGFGGILDDDGYPGEPCDMASGGCNTDGPGGWGGIAP